jgi:hypothetical protein
LREIDERKPGHSDRSAVAPQRKNVFPTTPGNAEEIAEALYEAFPKLDRHRGRGFQRVTPEDTVLELRNQIAAAARRKGHAPKVPDRCAEDSEDEAGARLRYVAWSHHEAQASRLSREWQPLEPAELFGLLARPSARLARDADELMSAVIESLGDYEGDLDHGRWTNLWDIGTKKVRHEKHLTHDLRDWLRDHLDVFGAREAELPTAGRTDILLQISPRRSEAKPLSVVIEIKKIRARNKKELRTAMETQLLPYLQRESAAEGWTHGLYVVMWTPKPGSAEDTPAGIEMARTQLAEQAAALTRTHPSFVLRSYVIDARHRR